MYHTWPWKPLLLCPIGPHFVRVWGVLSHFMGPSVGAPPPSSASRTGPEHGTPRPLQPLLFLQPQPLGSSCSIGTSLGVCPPTADSGLRVASMMSGFKLVTSPRPSVTQDCPIQAVLGAEAGGPDSGGCAQIPKVPSIRGLVHLVPWTLWLGWGPRKPVQSSLCFFFLFLGHTLQC